MTIDDMKKRKRELGYTNAQLAEISGVPLGTVQKIFGGATTAPRRSTLLALEKVLAPSDHTYNARPVTAAVNEPSAIYSAGPGKLHTLDDYYALPEDARVELIDGIFYDMTAPTTIHQQIGLELSFRLHDYISRNKGTCVPFYSPIDVQLDRDDRTMVEPDVIVVCDRSKIIRRCIYGAPDFVAEVLSPSTKSRDLIIKLNKYMVAGVREYWIIDPDAETVTVYDFEHEKYPVHYTFADRVPVAIWDGSCVIDFKEIKDYIAFIYENDPASD